MATFVFRLIPARPTFALDASDQEMQIMARHAAHWRRFIESGQMVVFGPVLDSGRSWGLGVIDVDDEPTLRAIADADPAITSGIGTIEISTMLSGYVRP